MEEAGKRYFECNPNHEVIRGKEIASDLAFYILFLNGNLHSDKNQTKSTKEQFISLCTDREHMKQIPEEFITKIYHDIQKNAFTTFGKKVVINSERQLQSIFEKKMQNVSRKAKVLMQAVSSRPVSPFTLATKPVHVQPMFQVSWSPCLAAFSVGLRDCNNKQITSLCLDGMQHAIRISCLFNMTYERDAFVNCLIRFSKMNTKEGTTEKECLQALIMVALDNGKALGKS